MVGIYRRTIQKGFNDQDNHNGVITHLEPDTLECAVKWALGIITMNKEWRRWNFSYVISNSER